MRKPRALISVWDKKAFMPFVKELHKLGWDLISSSGTADSIRKEKLPVIEVSELTNYPSILGGRVKTLHPAIAGGILFRRQEQKDSEELKEYNIEPIDLVLCTLYPFAEKARELKESDSLLDYIDIGGVTLIRSAAKNHPSVLVLTDVEDCDLVLKELRSGEVKLGTRRRLATKAFALTAHYDALISNVLASSIEPPELFPEALSALPLQKEAELRYGENPHQRARLYTSSIKTRGWELLAGKPLSYNNMLDLDAALRGCRLFSDACACIIIKHTTASGIAIGNSPEEAFARARDCDPVSAFGAIVGLTQAPDQEACKLLSKHFLEVLAVPDISREGLELLKAKRPQLVIVKYTGMEAGLEFRSTLCGILAQEDKLPKLPSADSGEWVGEARPDLWGDLLFAWKAAALSKSNAIVVAKDGKTLGIGRGFTSRVDAVNWALGKSGENSKGAVLASDAFFPFPDSIELAAEAGIAAIIQPGGSKKDEEVKGAAKRLDVSMFISGDRSFRH